MTDLKHAPLLGALAEFALELVQDEARARIDRLADEPLGHILSEIARRRTEIICEGRKPTQEDAINFLEQLPQIVARARAIKSR